MDRTGTDEPRTRRRIVGGLATLLVVALPWLLLVLFSRTPGPREPWINRLLAIALIVTYVGCWIGAIVASRKPRHMLIRALATTIVALAAIGILELAAGLRWVHWTLAFKRIVGEGVDYRTAFVLDEALSFRRIPGLRWSGRPASDVEEAYGLPASLERPITFTYDRWGYRNASDMPLADIVLLGDSFVEGWYVSDSETAAAQLAARLGRPVANLGVAGYGTRQQLRVLKGDALQRRPTIVVWVFFEGNDLYDDQSFENALLAGPPDREDRTPHRDGLTRTHGWEQRSFVLNAFKQARRAIHGLVPNRVPYWARLRAAGSSGPPLYFFGYGGVPWTKYEDDRWSIARAAFEEGLAFARERGIHVVLLYAPTKYRVFREFIELPPGSPMERWDVWHRLPEHFQQLCASAGVPCIDLTSPLQASLTRGLLPYWHADTHWNPEGHAIAAGAVEDVLRDHGW